MERQHLCRKKWNRRRQKRRNQCNTQFGERLVAASLWKKPYCPHGQLVHFHSSLQWSCFNVDLVLWYGQSQSQGALQGCNHEEKGREPTEKESRNHQMGFVRFLVLRSLVCQKSCSHSHKLLHANCRKPKWAQHSSPLVYRKTRKGSERNSKASSCGLLQHVHGSGRLVRPVSQLCPDWTAHPQVLAPHFLVYYWSSTH